MAEITAAMVKQLRDETQLPMMDCKKALQRVRRRHGSRQADAPRGGQEVHGQAAGPQTDDGRIGDLRRALTAGRRDRRVAVRVGPGGRQRRVRSNWPTIWPSNWPPAPAPRRPKNCGPSPRPASRA